MSVKMSKEELREIGDQILEDGVSGLKLAGATKYKWDQRLDHRTKTVTIKVQVTEFKKVE